MKPFLILALFFGMAFCAFGLGPQTQGSSHAQSGYDSKDITVAVVVRPADEGRMWLRATYSYPLLFSERDYLLKLVRAADRKIDIAVSNKTTISYMQEVGRFSTDTAAVVTVSFQTRGFESSYAAVQFMSGGNNEILLLNKKDTQDFINVLGGAHSLVDDYQRQVALFK